MGLLLFVIILLTMIGILLSTLVDQSLGLNIYTKEIPGHFISWHNKLKENVKKNRNNLRDDFPHNETKEHHSSESDKPFTYFRDKRRESLRGKLNLHYLTTHREALPFFASYLVAVYEQYEFSLDFTTAKNLLSELIKTKQAQSSSAHLNDIALPLEPSQEVYYKLLQGKRSQSRLSADEVPPLTTFFTFRSTKAAVFFDYAPELLLQVILGERAMTLLRQCEEEKQKLDATQTSFICSTQDLKTALPSFTQSIDELPENFFHFRAKKK